MRPGCSIADKKVPGGSIIELKSQFVDRKKLSLHSAIENRKGKITFSDFFRFSHDENNLNRGFNDSCKIKTGDWLIASS